MSVDSLYIPAVKKTCSEEFIKYVFWKHFLGKVTRIDFVPIIQSIDCNDDLNNENKIFHQVFLYKAPGEKWDKDMIKEIEDEQKGYYDLNFVPYQQEKDKSDCWRIQKNMLPIPNADTDLNIHQLYAQTVKYMEFGDKLMDTNRSLMTRITEAEKVNKELKQENKEFKKENKELKKEVLELKKVYIINRV